jgi:hypothetical protein
MEAERVRFVTAPRLNLRTCTPLSALVLFPMASLVLLTACARTADPYDALQERPTDYPLQLLGRADDDPEVLRYISGHECIREPSGWSCKTNATKLLVEEERRVHAIQFDKYGDKGRRFLGSLPSGLMWIDQRGDVERKLGRPTSSTGRTDRYDFEGNLLLLDYAGEEQSVTAELVSLHVELLR